MTVERNGQAPREPRLGTFKLTGLKLLGPVRRPFRPAALFDPADSKYAGVTLFAVETP